MRQPVSPSNCSRCSQPLREADIAILAIAAHAALHVFRPSRSTGQGGLYRRRRILYAAYVLWPISSTSLAFINPNSAFVNFQIYCTFPKRPFWYRLALSWIPRYMIFVVIVCIYASIYAYVRVKFHGFDNLGSHTGSMSAATDSVTGEITNQLHSRIDGESPTILTFSSAPARQKASVVSTLFPTGKSKSEADAHNVPEWDQADSVTVSQVPDCEKKGSGVSSSDFAPDANTGKVLDTVGICPQEKEDHTRTGGEQPTRPSIARTMSETCTVDTDFTADEETTLQENCKEQSNLTRNRPRPNQLAVTRRAIRRQLRFMFIYPLMYMLMWTLPLVNQCFNYSDWWAANKPFSLTVAATACLSLQAGVDSLVFSWRERPWRRSRPPNPNRTKSLLDGVLALFSRSFGHGSRGPNQDEKQVGSPKVEGMGRGPCKGKSIQPESHWWEVEGRKRKDSIWMGTDSQYSPPHSRRESSCPAHDRARSMDQKSQMHIRSRSADTRKPIHSRSRSTAVRPITRSEKAPEAVTRADPRRA